MIHIGFATASVVSAKTTVDICRKMVCKIFYFRTTLNALVNSPTTPYRDIKKMIKIYFKTKIIRDHLINVLLIKAKVFKLTSSNRDLLFEKSAMEQQLE